MDKKTKMKTRNNKNYMSIGVSVRTTKFVARKSGFGVRQESNPQSPTYSYRHPLWATITARQMTGFLFFERFVFHFERTILHGGHFLI